MATKREVEKAQNTLKLTNNPHESVVDELERINDGVNELSNSASKFFNTQIIPDIIRVQVDGIDKLRGEKGETGEVGPIGTQGERGPVGPKGDKGDCGESGLDGLDGLDGTDGEDGLDGKNGKDGSPDTGEQIIEKINALDDKAPKIDAKHIDNLPHSVERIIERSGFSVGGAETPIKNSNGSPLSKDASGAWVLPSGGGSGTVTSTSVVTANGVSGSVANPTTTPAITLTLGAITPTSVVASGAIKGAGMSTAIVLKTENYTATSNDSIILCDTFANAGFTVTLPTAVGIAGRTYTIADHGGNAAFENIIIDGDGSETINSSQTKTIDSAYKSITVVSNGTNWDILSTFASGGTGDVVGPSSAGNWAIARFDGTTGKLIQSSLATVDDTTGDITAGAYNGNTIGAGSTSGTNTGDQTFSDINISISDVSNNDVTTSAHGFAPKAPNDATKFLNGVGGYSVPAGGGISLFDHYSDSGNTNTDGTDDDLYSDTLSADLLTNNGDKVEADYGGSFVSSGTATRRIKILFAGNVIFDTGDLTLSLSSSWTTYVSIIRTNSSTIRYSITFATQGTALSAYTSVGELSNLTLADTNILKITGSAMGVGAAADDVLAKMGYVIYKPAA